MKKILIFVLVVSFLFTNFVYAALPVGGKAGPEKDCKARADKEGEKIDPGSEDKFKLYDIDDPGQGPTPVFEDKAKANVPIKGGKNMQSMKGEFPDKKKKVCCKKIQIKKKGGKTEKDCKGSLGEATKEGGLKGGTTGGNIAG